MTKIDFVVVGWGWEELPTMSEFFSVPMACEIFHKALPPFGPGSKQKFEK